MYQGNSIRKHLEEIRTGLDVDDELTDKEKAAQRSLTDFNDAEK